MARMVPKTYTEYVKPNMPNITFYSFGGWVKLVRPGRKDDSVAMNMDRITLVPGHVEDFDNGEYHISIPCIKAGTFRIELFFMKSSEAITALMKSFNTLNSKSRVQRGIFSNNQTTELCAPFLPDNLDSPDADPENICTIRSGEPGKSWFCEKPVNMTSEDCQNEKLIYSMAGWPTTYRLNFANITTSYGLDNYSEELIYTAQVEVSENEAVYRAKSLEKIPGYYKNQKWYSRVFNYTDHSFDPNLWVANRQKYAESGKNLCKGEILENKRFFLFGDSIGNQLWSDIEEEVRYYSTYLHSSSRNRKFRSKFETKFSFFRSK